MISYKSNSERFLLIIAILPKSARSSVSSIIFVLIVLDAFPVFHVFNWAFGSLDHRFTSFEWILSDKNNLCRSAPTLTQFNSHFWLPKYYTLYEKRIGNCILRTFWGVNQVSMTSSSRDMMYMRIYVFPVMTSFRMTSKSHFRWFPDVTPNFFWIFIPYPNSWDKDRRLPTNCQRERFYRRKLPD